MAISDSKKEVFTKISVYNALVQRINATDTTQLFPSINNKKDIVPYLIDILKVVVGTDAIQALIGNLFAKFIDNTEPKLKSAVKKQMIQYNSGDGLGEFKTTPVDVPAPDIDTYQKLKVNPESTSGQMLYDNNPNKPDFDTVMSRTIKNNGTESTFGPLAMSFNSDTNSFKFKPTLTGNPNPSVGQFLGDLVDNMTIINKKEIMSTVMNQFYGSITKDQKKTVEQVYQELQVNKLLEQLINDDDSFVISPEDLESLQKKAEEMVNGVVYYDMGCGVLEASLPLSGLSSLISSISGSTDPFYIGNQINNTLDDSTKNPDVVNENKQPMKDGFFQRLIEYLTLTLTMAVATVPQIRTLIAISSSFQNNGKSIISNAKDDLKKYKIFVKCLIKEAMAMINQFIFNYIISFLIKLIRVIVQKIIKEKTNQYAGTMKSLVTARNNTLNLTG